MIHFYGSGWSVDLHREAARRRGLRITEYVDAASLVFVCEEPPTTPDGQRDMEPVREVVKRLPGLPVVLTSQCPVGFCRSLGHVVYHQPELLRREDGMRRAMHPEMFIVGCQHPHGLLPASYLDYLQAFDCRVLLMTYEEAEFAKMAINATLVAQVENTNRLAGLAKLAGADWGRVSRALRHDSRIGQFSYLTPGRWQDSLHLLRDMVALEGLRA